MDTRKWNLSCSRSHRHELADLKIHPPFCLAPDPISLGPLYPRVKVIATQGQAQGFKLRRWNSDFKTFLHDTLMPHKKKTKPSENTQCVNVLGLDGWFEGIQAAWHLGGLEGPSREETRDRSAQAGGSLRGQWPPPSFLEGQETDDGKYVKASVHSDAPIVGSHWK